MNWSCICSAFSLKKKCFFSLKKKKNSFSYFFLAVLGLCCRGERSRCAGFSPWWPLLLRSMGSRAHRLQWRWPQALEHRPRSRAAQGLVVHVRSSRLKHRSGVSCTGRPVSSPLSHQEAPALPFCVAEDTGRPLRSDWATCPAHRRRDHESACRWVWRMPGSVQDAEWTAAVLSRLGASSRSPWPALEHSCPAAVTRHALKAPPATAGLVSARSTPQTSLMLQTDRRQRPRPLGPAEPLEVLVCLQICRFQFACGLKPLWLHVTCLHGDSWSYLLVFKMIVNHIP